MLIDSHCHLNMLSNDLPHLMHRANKAGLGLLVSIATRLDEVAGIAKIAATYPQVVYSVGVHPMEVQNYRDLTLNQLLELADKPKVVALGETGLDFYRNRDHEELQKHLFRIHIEAARQTGLPVVIHTRGADDETAQLLEEEMAKGAFPALIHCFTASKKFAEQALALGLYISLSGIITFKNAQDIRDGVAIMPLDRLLIETDAPYLAPVPVRGKTNEPAFVAHTAKHLAQLKGISADELAQITTTNFFQLFARAKQYANA